jgi:P27 family predicted phage terminase small subunit
MRGRKPVPTLLADLHGRPNKGRKPNPGEPKPAGELSTAPDWLSATQKATWDYAMRCAPPGLLKQLDRSVLTVWVVAEDLHRQATIAQTKVGGLVSRIKDTPVFITSPYLAIINQQAKVLLKSASELGFTPVSRPRISTGGVIPEGLNGDHPWTPSTGTLDDFLATDPDASPTIN